MLIRKHLPENIEICTDNLVIGTSQLFVSLFAPIRAYNETKFPCKQYLQQVIKASCNLPFVFGLLPTKLPNGYHYDGTLTQNWKNLPTYPNSQSQSHKNIHITAFHNGTFEKATEGWITPRFSLDWIYKAPSQDCLYKLYQLGYLRLKNTSSHTIQPR